MKRLRHFTSCIISLPLFFGLIATHYCAAEPIDEHKMAEATAVVPPQPQDFNPGIVNEGSSPAAAKEPNLPASSVTPDILTDLWRKLNPDGLWTNNDITAWAFLLGYIFAGMVLGKIVSILLLRVASGKDGVISKSLFDLAGPANLALVTLGIFAGLRWLKLEGTLLDFSGKTIKLMFTVAIFWYLYNWIGMVDPLLHHLSRNSNSALDKQVAPLVRRTLRVFLIIVTVMYVFKEVFGQDIGAWLAGLGIAGIAVSLAAQDSLKNLFGSITILLDRPFKIGDRIICSGYEGVIEDIGFRSTKVRTTAGHLVSIPNANVVNSPIENISRRPGIRRSFAIHLSPETPADKAKQAVKLVRDLLEDKEFRESIHPQINGEAIVPQVACGDFVNNNLLLTVTYWYAPGKSAEFAQHSERLNLRILEAFEKAAIQMAAAK